MRPKSLFFEICRWVAAVVALVVLILQFGGNTVSSANAEDVAAAVTQVMDMSNMQRADNKMLKRLYGLDPSAYESCIL